jgi:hypothetical protein
MMMSREAPDHVVFALRPLRERYGFRREQGMDDHQGDRGTFRVAFEAGADAVRFVWDADGGFVVLEALEPDFGDSWMDLELGYADLPRRRMRNWPTWWRCCKNNGWSTCTRSGISPASAECREAHPQPPANEFAAMNPRCLPSPCLRRQLVPPAK